MSKYNIIPAGYRFIFKSWEGDGDNEQTFVKEGVDEKEAKLLAELAQTDCGLENQCEPEERQQQKAYRILWPIFEKHKDVFAAEQLAKFKEDVGEMTDYINENMLGYSDTYWMRCLNSYKIEFIPQEIQIEDVTDRFKI